ncbi:putative disease resistance protein At1g50180 [Papaver somniferum]|uniref:putative disease resistance protein At1g50180 n=1 Tax=Papaver somniferum TaxID=3469 RepID=UPI000E703C56|nr:putative disease resistance protein At1g50180 [Papaver somniferum]
MEAVIKFFLGKLTTLISDEIGLLSGVDDEVRQLQKHLQWMSESIKYADEKRRSSQLVRIWLGQIREIAFDAEDVIDEFIVKVHLQRLEQQLKKKPSIGAHIKESLRCCFTTTKQLPLRHEFGIQIRVINDKVKKLSTTKDMYSHLLENGESGFGTSMNNISSTSLQEKIKSRRAAIAKEEYRDAANIHENSAKRITNSLMGNEGNGDQKRLRIISIVGMGGVGKTTLAKRAYNDDIVMQNFETCAFVYVSQTYIVKDLLRSIMKKFFSVSNEEEVSCSRLYNYLQGNKYLIVLDDIWDTDAWDGLKSAFPDEKNGSRVLLTTRHKHVARYADSSCSSNIHELGVITEFDQSWELFLKKTFPSSSSSQQPVCPKELEYLGKQMVEKCHGLPLAIVVLGSLLSSKERSEHEWSRVNDSVNWHLSQGNDAYKCSGILALSYYDLPYFLKPCFLYMSLFPEDSEIRATKLYQYWIAEGFVQKRDQQTPEDVAEDYLVELISRSLIQIDRFRCDGRVKTCRIHDLLRDLAIAESKEDQFSQIFRGVQEFYLNQSNVRRVAVCSTADDSQKEHYFNELRHLITVRSLMCRGLHFMQLDYLNSSFGGFKLLRVLEFSGSTGISTGQFPSLPKELGELLHLRYLSLEDTKLERLNTSYLRKLVNLQILNLNRCGTKLTLDDKIGSLHQLRHLYLGGLSHDTSGTSTVSNHLGIGNLTNLQTLRIEAGNWIYGGALKNLCSLKKLRIDGCLSAHSEEISDAIMKLVGLKSLLLQSLNTLTDGVPLISISFASHTNLHNLLLKGELHAWTGSVSFPPNLTKLILEDSRIVTDPMVILEKLPKLTFLHLGFKSYAGEKMVCSAGGFASLQTLRLVSLERVEQWIVEKGAMEKLTRLEILLCGKLAKLPLKQLISLQKLILNATHYTPSQWSEAPELASLIRP